MTDDARDARRGVTVWFTGMPGAGKSTQAQLLAGALRTRGLPVEILDGDEVRKNLSKGLGFSREDRDENIARIAFVARLLSRNGVWVVVAAVSPYRAAREAARAAVEADGARFVEVWMACDGEVLAARDPKGLYRRAREGDLKQLTGVDDPYEPPEQGELVLHSDTEDERAGHARLLAQLVALGLLDARVSGA